MADSGLQPLNFFILYFPYSLAVLIVLLRLCRRTAEKRFSLDDGLILMGMLVNTVLTVSTHIFLIKSYTGYRLVDIPKGAVDKVLTAKLRYINSVTYHPALNFIKISFLVTLIRLQSPNRWVQYTLWFFLSITVAFSISITITGIVSCIPIERFWDKSIPGHCRDSESYILAAVITTMITDILITGIPTLIVYNLQMPWKSKAVVLCFMSLGFFVTAITIYRMVFFIRIFQDPDPIRNENPYNIRTPLSNLEVNLSAIASCGPTIKWLLGRCIPFFDSQKKRPSQYKYSENIPSRSHTRRSNLEPPIAEDTVIEANNGSAVELKDQVVWKQRDDRDQPDARSEEHQILADDGTEPTVANGKYVKYNATQPRPMV